MLSKPLKLAIAFLFFNLSFLFSEDFYEYEKALILSDKFYYILNLNEKTITMKFNGIEMIKYKTESINFLVPKIFFFKFKPKIFPSIFYLNNVKINPPVYLLRPTLNPEEKKENEKPKIPPTLEELIRVPKKFTIKGEEAFSIDISLKKEANFPYKISFFNKIKKRFKEFFKGLTLSKEQVIFIEMDNPEGEKFYRSFQENSSFLILLETSSMKKEQKQ